MIKVTYSPTLGQFGIDGYFVRVDGQTVGAVEQYELRIPQMSGRVLIGHQVFKRWRCYRVNPWAPGTGFKKIGWDRCPTRKQATAELLQFLGY